MWLDPGKTGAFLSKEGSLLGNAQGETPAGTWCFPAEGTQHFFRRLTPSLFLNQDKVGLFSKAQ